MLCAAPSLMDSTKRELVMCQHEDASLAIRMHKLLIQFNGHIRHYVRAEELEPLAMMRTDATRMIHAYKQFPAFSNEGDPLLVSIAELGNFRICIDLCYPFAAIKSLWELSSLLPVAQRISIAQSTLNAYSPLVLTASTALDEVVMDWLNRAMTLMNKKEKGMYLVELTRRMLLACSPASASALVRAFTNGAPILSRSRPDVRLLLSRLNRPDKDLRWHTFRAWMRAVVAMGAALLRRPTRASNNSHECNAQHPKSSSVKAIAAPPGNSYASGARLNATESWITVCIRWSALHDDVSKRRHTGAVQRSKGLPMWVRLFPQDASMSLQELSREAIWVAMLAAADGPFMEATGLVRCTRRSASSAFRPASSTTWNSSKSVHLPLTLPTGNRKPSRNPH